MAVPTGPLLHDLQAARLAGQQTKELLYMQVGALHMIEWLSD